MVDAYCKHKDCGEAMGGDEFGLSIMDFGSKKLYVKALQEFHDDQYHTTLEEKLTCDCGHKSKDATEALDHHMNCPKSGYVGKQS